jgi:hypothetical protein
MYVVNWLRTLHSVSAVGPPVIAADGMSAYIWVRTATVPRISNVRMTVSPKPAEGYLVQLDVG